MKRNTAPLGIMGTLICLAGLNTAALAAPNETTAKQAGSEGQSASSNASASVLQVTGTTNSFTVSAQHADVLSLLKLVFDQAHRQFVPDASVTGDVTFALSGQRFDTVLAAICRQTFLRYEIDKQGIYQFRRDEEALRNLLLKTQAINSVLSDQLLRMGYAVPSAPLGRDSANGNRAYQNTQQAPGGVENGAGGGFDGGGTAGGGFGRGSRGADAASASRQESKDTTTNAPAPSQVPNNIVSGRQKVMQDKSLSAGNADTKAEAARKSDNRSGADETQKPQGINGAVGQLGTSGPAGQSALPGFGARSAGRSREAEANALDTLPLEPNIPNAGQYQTFMKQNNFVSVNTRGEKTPVQQVLTDLSKQSGVPILIDPDVPKGEDFVVSGTISARPLNEMLNILGYYARLEWRWVNSRIYITTTPQLQLYLHNSLVPAPGQSGNIGNGITILPQRSAAPASQTPPKKIDDAEKTKKDQKDKGE